MSNAGRLGRREEDQQWDRKSHEESQSHGSFWGKLTVLLTIFGTVFSVTTFVVPVESTVQKLALSTLLVSVSSMIYRGFVALLDKKLDWIFAVLVLVTLGLGSWYVVLLVEDRDSTIMALKDPNSVKSALPEFDKSDADTYSSGTVKLVVGQYGLQLHSYSSVPYSDGDGSDILFRGTGVFGQGGTQFVLLSVGSDNSFATCRDQTSWVPVLDWNQINRGSLACVKASTGRRGILRIDQMPKLDSPEPTVQVTGHLWTPIVDQ